MDDANNGGALRPTPAPFGWAEPYLTIGTTGTNGKTSTTTLIAHVLRAAGHPVLCETTLGYALGDEKLEVPRTVDGFLGALRQAAERGCRHAAIEVTSEALARGFAKRWRFDFGVFTNLTRDHIEAHGSFEHYLASKAQLFVHLGPGRTAVLNACDESSLLIAQVTPPDVSRLWYAGVKRRLRQPDLAAQAIHVAPEGTRIELEPGTLAERLGGVLEIRLVGDVFAENALAAAGATLAAGVSEKAIRAGLAACPGVPGRFEVVHRAPVVAVDYAHTPDALARTCDTARKLAGRGRVIVVFGAGGNRDREKRGPMGRAVGERADIAIVTTDNPRTEDPRAIANAAATGCRKGGRAYVRLEPDRYRAIEMAIDEAREADVVVIAGKGHETGQIIADVTLPFSDVTVATDVLRTRRP
jgi:UDP-N-acetylmuramoyl-L-alanyl-D-glutamate--2,6-diaminopimelate ligase